MSDDSDPPVSLLGSWKLVSFVTQDGSTGRITEPFGRSPGGYLSYGHEGRMHALIVKEGRRAPMNVIPTQAEQSELFSGLIAYSGRFTVAGEQVTHHVDISWNEALTGTDQVRLFSIRGSELTVRSPLEKSPLDGKVSMSTAIWRKAG